MPQHRPLAAAVAAAGVGAGAGAEAAAAGAAAMGAGSTAAVTSPLMYESRCAHCGDGLLLSLAVFSLSVVLLSVLLAAPLLILFVPLGDHVLFTV